MKQIKGFRKGLGITEAAFISRWNEKIAERIKKGIPASKLSKGMLYNIEEGFNKLQPLDCLTWVQCLGLGPEYIEQLFTPAGYAKDVRLPEPMGGLNSRYEEYDGADALTGEPIPLKGDERAVDLYRIGRAEPQTVEK